MGEKEIGRFQFKKILLQVQEIYSQSLLSEIIAEATSSFGSNKLCNQASNFLGDEYTHKLINIHTNLEESNEGNGPYTASFCFLGAGNIPGMGLSVDSYSNWYRIQFFFKEKLVFIMLARLEEILDKNKSTRFIPRE
ncbi:hypothetical protein C1646_755500 [Rhizophagus diaphanus]|nr:hypothetical protein C1646_755500 [Rhizophagus diaphanus] [Rhizophagus sp. MUCL 43196]